MIRQEELFRIGRFAKPHGVKGEISLQTTIELLDDIEEPYLVCDIEGIFVPFFIEEYRYKGSTIILIKLEGVDTEEQARKFMGREVYLPYELVDEEENLLGEMTWDSFIGYRVRDDENNSLGVITAVDESTQNILFHIEHDGKEILFPAAEELITAVDHIAKEIQIHLPEGLLDLW